VTPPVSGRIPKVEGNHQCVNRSEEEENERNVGKHSYDSVQQSENARKEVIHKSAQFMDWIG
jgi:hypothetical protein